MSSPALTGLCTLRKYRRSRLGILKNVAKTTDLGAPATRELVAELLFRAIADAPMVTYTAGFRLSDR